MSKSSWGAATQNFRPRESHEPAQRSHRAECTLEAGKVVVGGGGCSLGCFITTCGQLKKNAQSKN